MHEPNHIDVDALMREIACYLAAVDAFRAESREPTWLPELTARVARARRRQSVRSSGAPGTHGM